MANTAQSKDRAAVKGGLDDLLGNVIRSDRQRAGRAEPSAASGSPVTSQPAAQLAIPQTVTPDPTAQVSDARSSSEPQASSQPSSPSTGPSDTMTDTHSDIMTNGHAADGDQIPKTEMAPKSAAPRAEAAKNAPKSTARPAQAQARRKPATAPTKSSGSHQGRLSERVEEAVELAATQTITVTLRIPQGFNDWLDGYVHGAWPEKIRKQELVVEGLMLAYARRGLAGEEIIGTALLGENEDAEGS